MKTKIFVAIIWFIRLLIPLSYFAKYILVKIRYPKLRKYYKYSNTHGGFEINKITKREDLENFCRYIVPDHNMRATYYRLLNGKLRFIVKFSFDEYLSCDKLDIVKYTATKESYKLGKINNFNYTVTYEDD